MSAHPVLDSGAASLRVLGRFDRDGTPLALLEVVTWVLAEIPPDNIADARPGSLWFGQPAAPSPAADVGAAP